MVNVKIVMGCFEVPGFGGAATLNHELFAQLQERGEDISWINLIPADRTEVFVRKFGSALGNPESRPRVHNIFLRHPPFGPQPDLAELICREKPDVLVGCHFIAAKLFHQEGEGCPLVFITAGFRWIQEVVPHRFRCATEALEHLRLHGPTGLPPVPPAQDQAFRGANVCLVQAPVIKELYTHFYPQVETKIAPQIKWEGGPKLKRARHFENYVQEWGKRDIDLLFVASDWSRKIKNYGLALEILARFPDRHCAVVGDLPDELGPVAKWTQHLGFVNSRDEIHKILGRSKVVVSPSSWDTAPGILYEATGMGCNIVCSQNCGNWEMCPESFLARDYTAEGFQAGIARALEGHVPICTQDFETDCVSLILQTAASLCD